MTEPDQPEERQETPPLGSFMTITAEAEVIPGPVDDEEDEVQR